MNKEKALKNQGLEFREDMIYRKGDIPCSHDKPPYQNDPADNAAQNKVEGDDTHRSGYVIPMRYKPYEHTANTKGNTAAQPYIKVIGLPVLCKDVLEHEE